MTDLGSAQEVCRVGRTATRRRTAASPNKVGYNVVPLTGNLIMVEIAAMRERGVHVGRLFPAMPEHLRVTIGTPEQMERFVDAFRAVMA